MPNHNKTLLFALGLAPRKIGGIEKFLFYLTRELQARGWSTVLCFDGDIAEEFRSYIAAPSVQVTSLDGQANLGLGCAKELRRLLARHRPQVFMYGFHGLMRVFPWLAWQAGTRQILYNDHSSRPFGEAATPLLGYKQGIARLLARPVSGLISVSHFVAQSSAQRGQTNAPNRVIWNGVEILPPDPDRGARFRTQHGIPPGVPVIATVCWMVPAKGVEVLLRAAAGLDPSHPLPWLLLVGEGPHRDEYQTLGEQLGLGDRLCFTGMVSNPVSAGVFDACDIYCQPSLWQEAMGLAVVEAMSMERPVIASDIGGLPETVHPGKGGLLFPPGDSNALRDCLTQLLSDPDLRQRMGQYNRDWVLHHHDIRDTARQYADCICDLKSLQQAPSPTPEAL